MKYKIGTLEEYLIENPKPVDDDLLQKRSWRNPRKANEYLWESKKGNIEDNFNILATWGIMRKPPFTKYYIANNNGFYIFGKAEPNSWPSFGSKVTDIEIFDTEAAYLKRIKKLKIVLEEDV